ncbi:hypothetical protein [Saprospira grandis]|nr:hypothetical protein [Saprospira grandis]WBM74962.1 hypothetical protein OP864_01735 [Saprospira grandis]
MSLSHDSAIGPFGGFSFLLDQLVQIAASWGGWPPLAQRAKTA